MNVAAHPMKLYKNLIDEVARTLQLIFTENRYADKAVERTLKSHPQWGSRDRRFVAEAVYDVVRNYRLFASLTGSEKNYWFMTAVWLVSKGYELPEWPEFRHVNQKQILEQKLELEKDPRFLYSYPDWLWDYAAAELGENKWKKEAQAMHEQASVYLRVNTLKTNKQELAKAFEVLHEPAASASGKSGGRRNGLVEVPGVESALKLEKRENVFQHKRFKDGWFEVQDAGSQLISSYLDPHPGQFVIDACAGAGGKSLHLAAIMRNKGRIVSMDVEEKKLEELKRRAKRAGVHVIETKLAEQKNIEALNGKADRLLMDVPCSGTGVIKRNPDAKWKLSAASIERTRGIQSGILSSYSYMLKKGGVMVYSTCSILPSENEAQVSRFLSEHPDFRLEDEKTILPSEGFDGFYMARMTRVN
jgi:16S rRNA (cytosine967-C5)-methyltransferase